MDGHCAQDTVKVLEGPLTIESGLLARLVKRADGTVEVEVWDAAGWEPAAGRVSVGAFIEGIPAEPELLAELGVST